MADATSFQALSPDNKMRFTHSMILRLVGILCYTGDTMEHNGLQAHTQSSPTLHATMQTSEQQQAAAIESLLFVSGRPLTCAELRKLLGCDESALERALARLEQDLGVAQRGIRLQILGEQVQLVTAPEYAHYVAALLGLPMTAKLTTAALETLAVISYRQPITRSQIEAIRGVNSDRALASLLQHGLVAEVGRAQTVGRPALFATTAEFLQLFGLTRLEQLPHVTPPASMSEAQCVTIDQHEQDAERRV